MGLVERATRVTLTSVLVVQLWSVDRYSCIESREACGYVAWMCDARGGVLAICHTAPDRLWLAHVSQTGQMSPLVTPHGINLQIPEERTESIDLGRSFQSVTSGATTTQVRSVGAHHGTHSDDKDDERQEARVGRQAAATLHAPRSYHDRSASDACGRAGCRDHQAPLLIQIV